MAFEEITADAFAEGVEEQEIADPVMEEAEEQGAEEPEVTAPASEEPEGRTAADAAFAEMRRRAEEAERLRAEALAELEDLKSKQAAREAALEELDIDEIDAISEVTGMTREEVLETIEREEEAAEAEIQSKEKDRIIEELQDRINEVEAEKIMAQDLANLQKIDPKLKELTDLGEDFFAYIAAGLSAEQAYYAIKGREITTRSTPAVAPGKITEATPPEKDYFTEEEVANMTSEQKTANAEKIMKSLPLWYKK